MTEPNIVLSDCCKEPIVFAGLFRKDNRTFGIYQCPNCLKEYERG